MDISSTRCPLYHYWYSWFLLKTSISARIRLQPDWWPIRRLGMVGIGATPNWDGLVLKGGQIRCFFWWTRVSLVPSFSHIIHIHHRKPEGRQSWRIINDHIYPTSKSRSNGSLMSRGRNSEQCKMGLKQGSFAAPAFSIWGQWLCQRWLLRADRSSDLCWIWGHAQHENQINAPSGNQTWPFITELDDGKIYRKALYLMVEPMVSCRFSLKPIHWIYGSVSY